MEPIEDRGSSAFEALRGATFISIEDQKELAFVAFRMEERRATPQQVQEAVARTRLGQIERDEQALAVVDAPQLERQGRAAEQGARAALDHHIRYVDSIYSGLAPIDRAMAGYLAHLANAQTKAITYESLLVQVRAAGLSLEEAVLERQLAAAAGAPPAALAAYDARIAGARLLLDGSPAATGRIQQLDERPGQDEAALRARIDALEQQDPANALLARLDAARAAYDAAAQRMARQEGELQAALADYRAGVNASVPGAVARIGELRASLSLEASRPDLDQALGDLAAVLPTATPEELGAALARIDSLGDAVLRRLEGADGILSADPRLRVVSGRKAGIPSGLEGLTRDLVPSTALAGIPSLPDVLLGSTGEESAELLEMMRSSVTLESTAMRAVPALGGPVLRVSQRPHEVLDLLLSGGDEAREVFRRLCRAGWTADEARTILTLARNGRTVEEVTAALAGGRSLDDLVAETLFRTVGAAEAHRLSGIPQTFRSGKAIEDVAAVARRRGVDILVRGAKGGEIDLLAVVQKEGPEYGFVGSHTPRDVAIRADLGGIASIADGPTADGVSGLIRHGDAVSYFNTARTWGPAVAFTSYGGTVWLGSADAVEYWLKLRNVSAEPYARYSHAVSWLAGRYVPLSSTSYLAGTAVGDLPQGLWAPATTSGTPTRPAQATSTPAVTSTPSYVHRFELSDIESCEVETRKSTP